MGGQEGAGENPYPRVLMGSIAHFRQAMLDADHLPEAQRLLSKHMAAPGRRSTRP